MKTSTLFLALVLAYTTVSAQKIELKRDLLLTEDFKGDTFNGLFRIYSNYTRRTSEFAGLRLLTQISQPNSYLSLNVDTLNHKYLGAPFKYDSIEAEVTFRPKDFLVPGLIKVKTAFMYGNTITTTLNTTDTGVKVLSGFFPRSSVNEFHFMLRDTSTSIYIETIKIYGLWMDSVETDTLPNDTTPNTGIKEEFNSSINVFGKTGQLAIVNPDLEPLSIIVYDITGRVIKNIPIKGNEIIPIERVGVYITIIRDQKGNSMSKRIFVN